MKREFQPDTIIAQQYRIKSKIASGGMGTTYHAYDNNTKKDVALKVLDFSEVNDWKMIELFNNECELLKTLNHPLIPDYIDNLKITENNQETYILVQEFIEGSNLKDMIKGGKVFTKRECINILTSILEVLSYIHTLKPALIHKDINPKNIIIDKTGRVFLVDFGTAGLIVKDALMAKDTFTGTIGYIPPEQMYGKTIPQSDIYSLGLTIIYLLTGVDPSSLPIKNLKINYRKLAVSDNENLYNLLDMMIEPNPDKRIGNANELLEILNTKVEVLSEKEDQKKKRKIIIINTVKIALLSLLMVVVYMLNKFFPFVGHLDVMGILDLSEEAILSFSYFFPLSIIIPYLVFSLFFNVRIQSQKTITFRAMIILLLSGLCLNFIAMVIDIPFFIYILYSTFSLFLITLYLGRWKKSAWIESIIVIVFMFFFSLIGLYMINFFIWVLLLFSAIAFNYKKVNKIIRAVCITVLISLSVVSTIFTGILSAGTWPGLSTHGLAVIRDLKLPFHLGGMVNIRFTDEDTPLHLAVENENTHLLKLLLHKGADINFLNLDGETPLHRAVEESKPELVRLLITYGVHVDYRVKQDALTALQKAVSDFSRDQANRLEVVNILIDAGADIFVKDWRGANLFHLACGSGNTEIVKFLLEKNFDIESTDNYGNTPLHYAADSYSTSTLEILLRSSAHINAVNDNNETPVFNAVNNEEIDLVKHLLKNGANINIKNKEGNTPLSIAKEYGYSEIAALINSYNK